MIFTIVIVIHVLISGQAIDYFLYTVNNCCQNI